MKLKYILKSLKHAQISKNHFDTPDIDDLIIPSIKYGSWNFAYNNTSKYVRSILDKIPIQNNHKSVLVDIKVHTLEIGERPTLPNWHIDCVTNPFDPRPEEVHHIFVAGKCLTEFLEEDIEIDISPIDRIANFNKYCEGQKITTIPNRKIVTYGRFPHRGAICNIPETRLLIRVTESDILKPKNQVFEPTKTKQNL